jgi:hypothetical protein
VSRGGARGGASSVVVDVVVLVGHIISLKLGNDGMDADWFVLLLVVCKCVCKVLRMERMLFWLEMRVSILVSKADRVSLMWSVCSGVGSTGSCNAGIRSGGMTGEDGTIFVESFKLWFLASKASSSLSCIRDPDSILKRASLSWSLRSNSVSASINEQQHTFSWL